MNPFVAEIRIFPFGFAPKGWAFCQGQLLPISQNTALFSLLGTTYGGDGKSTFALPDLQDRIPMGFGQGPGLSLYDLGQFSGSATVTLLESEMPAHSHNIAAVSTAGTTTTAENNNLAALAPSGTKLNSYVGKLYSTATPSPLAQMSLSAVTAGGGGQPHNNRMPTLTFSFCIALQGVFPPRT